MTEQYNLSSIDESTLAPVLRQALNRESIKIDNWTVSRVYGGAGDVGAVLSGVFRFAGQAHDQVALLDWSLILKVVGTTAADDDPSEHRYWKREVLAYQSERLVDLPGNLAAPRFFGTLDFSEKVIGLWLEDLTDDVGPKWLLEQYGIVARHLGQMNGAFLAQKELPSWPWLSRDGLQHIADENQAGRKFTQLRQSLAHLNSTKTTTPGSNRPLACRLMSLCCLGPG